MNGERRPFAPEDSLDIAYVRDAQITVDGALIAFVVGDWCRPDAERGPTNRIWLVPADGSAPARVFSGGPGSDHTPRWSPDGQTLAFLSNRAGAGDRIYLLPRAGGEAQILGDLAGSPMEISWSSDGRQIAFLMNDPEDAQLRQRRDDAGGVIEVGADRRQTRLYTIDVADGTTRVVTSGATQIWEYVWAPDGSFIVVTGESPIESSWFSAQLARVAAAGGDLEPLYSAAEKQFVAPRVAPDGRQIAVLSGFWSDRGGNAGDILLLTHDAALLPVRNLTEGYAGSIWWIRWSADGGHLDALAYEQGDTALLRIDVATGVRETRWRGAVRFDETLDGSYLAADGTLAVVREDANSPADVWVWRAGEWQQRTHLHPQLAGLALGETRLLHWQSPDGLAVQGQLLLPVGYVEGQRVPLVVWVHGGPADLFTRGFYGAGRYMMQIFAGMGYATLMTNPRGSTGWGAAFLEANIADFGGGDYQDIVAGVDYVIGLGIADAERLAIGGWSYGGFMAAWAIGQTQRFKAALAGAAITNWRSFHGTADIGAWDQISLRATPYAVGNIYDQRSPITYAAQITTPTLILHGQNDIIVPASQGMELYRALCDHGIPAEMALYPREPHGLQERAHILDRSRRYIAWLKKYL